MACSNQYIKKLNCKTQDGRLYLTPAQVSYIDKKYRCANLNLNLTIVDESKGRTICSKCGDSTLHSSNYMHYGPYPPPPPPPKYFFYWKNPPPHMPPYAYDFPPCILNEEKKEEHAEVAPQDAQAPPVPALPPTAPDCCCHQTQQMSQFEKPQHSKSKSPGPKSRKAKTPIESSSESEAKRITTINPVQYQVTCSYDANRASYNQWTPTWLTQNVTYDSVCHSCQQPEMVFNKKRDESAKSSSDARHKRKVENKRGTFKFIEWKKNDKWFTKEKTTGRNSLKFFGRN